MQVFDKEQIAMASQLIIGCYGREYCNTPEELSRLISDEFETEVTPDQVKEYIKPLITEEVEQILIYKNL